jgi:23S rRNA (cytosine1962-C5)-methyltransferase
LQAETESGFINRKKSMNMPAKIVLRSGKDEAVRRFHPWVFSGAIKKIYGDIAEGDIVDVYSNQDEYLASGHYQIGSIAVRIFSYDQNVTAADVWKDKITKALEYRKTLGLMDGDTNAWRLIYAEGDGLPGLIIDWYNGVAVMQAHSIGMYNARFDITNILKELFGDAIKGVYDKSAETLPKKAETGAVNGYLWGEKGDGIVTEHGCRYHVDWEQGQKTGFFVDQRENRSLLRNYCKGKKVLNTFCYTGGFSVSALKAGASLVHSVDSSARAIDLTKENLILNGFNPEEHQCFAEDTLRFLEHSKEQYDVIILDPPAYAKHHDVRHNAVQGYKRLNAEALRRVAPGGVIFTFSCSQVVDRKLFNSTVIAAAIQAGRNVRIVHQLSQPLDHPINAFHPEGEYLKGLVLHVE